MGNRKYNFIAPLSNVDDTILGIYLFSGFQIEKWPLKRYTALIEQCFGEDPDDLINDTLSYNSCIDEDKNDIFIVTGEIDPTTYSRELPDTTSFEDKIIDRGGYFKRLNEKINMMRLIKEGHIALTHYYIYETPDEPMMSGGKSSNFPLSIPFILTPDDKLRLDILLREYNPPFEFSYLQLAYENFIESYDIHELHLCFLILMIAFEVLFNAGHQELKYRITRGTAVLLGETKDEAFEIYANMQKLYDKRSLLVHTGKYNSLTYSDIFLLRHYLRNAILSLLTKKIDKNELIENLTACGFGQPIA
ncbi:MAG: hypothetical protein JXI43_14575 [Tissierellales bacterium]|nr:hypothetical protein [Tissierellales bacterium]